MAESKNSPLLQLMHDAVNRVNNIKSLSGFLEKDSDLSPRQQMEIFKMISTSADELNKVLDKYYIDSHENKTIVSQASTNEIKAKNFCSHFQIKESSPEYNEIMARSVERFKPE